MKNSYENWFNEFYFFDEYDLCRWCYGDSLFSKYCWFCKGTGLTMIKNKASADRKFDNPIKVAGEFLEGRA